MKATPIPVTMAPPPVAAVQPKTPRRSTIVRHPLVDVVPRTDLVPDRKPSTLTTLAYRLQTACGISEHEWHHKRTPYLVSCRRAIAVLLRRSRIMGHWCPPSYPEIAAAMGRSHHSGILGMCREYHDDPKAQEYAAAIESIVATSGHGLYSMNVVGKEPKRAPHPTGNH